MTFLEIIKISIILMFSGWALRRTWIDMGRPWPEVLTCKQRSTKPEERIIFVTRRH